MRNSTLLTALCVAALPAATISATPIFDSFGSFPNATFGGTGIPNNAVAASKQIIDGDTTITIALAATQRFSNPPLTNDGAGTYFAEPGSNTPSGTTTPGAKWNFNYYIEVTGGGKSIDSYDITLFYDLDEGADTSFGDLGQIDISGAVAASAPGLTLAQDSQNLLFSFLNVPGTPFVTTPTSGETFDADDLGEYTFAIGVTDGFFPLESVAIDVVVPEPGTLALLGLGSLGLIRRTRR